MATPLEKLELQIAAVRELLAGLEAQAADMRKAQESPSEPCGSGYFEDDHGNCPDCGKELRLIPAGRGRTGQRYDAFIGCKGFPYCRYARPLEEPQRKALEQERVTHHETHLEVDHRSTSAANSFDMRETILYEVDNLGGRVTKTNLWLKLQRKRKGDELGGYRVFMAMLEELDKEGKIQLTKSPQTNGREFWHITKAKQNDRAETVLSIS
jgi:hypothetical protein